MDVVGQKTGEEDRPLCHDKEIAEAPIIILDTDYAISPCPHNDIML
jgi:hypothetical protein